MIALHAYTFFMANISLFIVYTLAIIIGWSLFVVISIQIKRLVGYSKYLKPLSVVLFWLLVFLTIAGYALLIVHVLTGESSGTSTPTPGDNFVF